MKKIVILRGVIRLRNCIWLIRREHEGMSTETASNATSGIVRWRQCSEYYFVLTNM